VSQKFYEEAQIPTGEQLAKLIAQSEQTVTTPTITVNEETGGRARQVTKQRFEYSVASTPFAAAGIQGEQVLVEAQRLGWVDGSGQVTAQGKASGMSQAEINAMLGVDVAPPAPSSANKAPEAPKAPVTPAAPVAGSSYEAAVTALGVDGVYEYAVQLAEDPFLPVDASDAGFVHMEQQSLAVAGKLATEMGIDVAKDGEALSEFVRGHSGFGDAVMAFAMKDSSHLKSLFQAFKETQYAHMGKDAK
jgi:hypothetical protein